MEDLKLIIAWAISPLIIGMGLQLAGWGMWLWKRKRVAFACWGVSLLVLLIGSLPVLSYEANRSREFHHEPLNLTGDLDPAHPVVAVVLGTGFNPDPWLPQNSRVSGTAHARFLEGVRIYRNRPDVRLLVSVANDEADPADKAAFLDEMIKLLALDPARVELVTEAESTEDEARLAIKHVKDGEQVVVVTSAGHMPRAMTIFADADLKPIAAPCDFWYPRAGSPHEKKWKQWIPSSGGIGGTRQMLYEGLASLMHAVGG